MKEDAKKERKTKRKKRSINKKERG